MSESLNEEKKNDAQPVDSCNNHQTLYNVTENVIFPVKGMTKPYKRNKRYQWTPELKRLTMAVLDELERREKTAIAESKTEMMFVDSEWDDEAWTEYERRSTLCEIGARARDPIVGHALLLFMRAIIDKLPSIFIDALDQTTYSTCNANPDGWKVSDIADAMSKYSEKQCDRAPIDKLLSRTFVEDGGHVTEEYRAEDLTLWSVDTVRRKLESCFVRANKVGKNQLDCVPANKVGENQLDCVPPNQS